MSEICITSSSAATRGIRFLPVVVGPVVSEQHSSYPGDDGSGLRHCPAVLARHQDIDILAGDFLGGGDGVERCGLQRRIIVLGDDEGSHQITRASVLSLSTSSATEPTLWPPWRFAGSSTLSTTRRGVASTPSASGVVVAIGFFFAFMMLGSEA